MNKAMPAFRRDQCVWAYYGLVGLNCYIVSALGPAMPFIRSELKLNYRVAGLHFSAFAVGSVISGLIGHRVLARVGNVRSIFLSVIGTILGLLFLVFAHHAVFSIFGILIAGFSVSLLYQGLATVIAAHLGESRTIAFVEGEVSAMLVAGIAPVIVSACVACGAGWRAAYVILIALFLVGMPSIKTFDQVQGIATTTASSLGKLPLAFWGYGAVILLSVAAEWSTAFWSADYLHSALAMSKATAAAAVASFFFGMVAGRYGGTRLVRAYSPAQLLVVSSFVSMIGFGMFWLGRFAAVNVAGLFLTGLGIANMYPLSFSAAVAAAAEQTSKAIARVQLLAGLAILVAPVVLSIVADHSGLFAAYSVVAAILVVCLGSIFAANRFAKKHAG